MAEVHQLDLSVVKVGARSEGLDELNLHLHGDDHRVLSWPIFILYKDRMRKVDLVQILNSKGVSFVCRRFQNFVCFHEALNV
jgi:hypothetical protein